MPDEIAILKLVVERREGAGLVYMVSGSVALNFYTQPRMTRDSARALLEAGLRAEGLIEGTVEWRFLQRRYGDSLRADEIERIAVARPTSARAPR